MLCVHVASSVVYVKAAFDLQIESQMGVRAKWWTGTDLEWEVGRERLPLVRKALRRVYGHDGVQGNPVAVATFVRPGYFLKRGLHDCVWIGERAILNYSVACNVSKSVEFLSGDVLFREEWFGDGYRAPPDHPGILVVEELSRARAISLVRSVRSGTFDEAVFEAKIVTKEQRALLKHEAFLAGQASRSAR